MPNNRDRGPSQGSEARLLRLARKEIMRDLPLRGAEAAKPFPRRCVIWVTNRSGVSLIEIMTAAVILTVAVLALFTVNSSSNRMTMDAYFEFLALQIAQEPLEVFRAVGYPECMNLTQYPVGTSMPIKSDTGLYPLEATMFERKITVDKGLNPLALVTVTVSPRENTMAAAWLKRGKNSVIVKTLLPNPR